MASNKTFTLSIAGVEQSITKVSDLKNIIKSLDKELDNAELGSAEFKQLQAEALKAKNALKDLQNQTEEVTNISTKAGENAKKMGADFDSAFSLGTLAAGETGEALQGLTGGFDSVKGGLKTVVSGFSTLKGAIASTGIGLLLLAFGALVTYFTKSQEGINLLERKMAAFGAIMSLVTDVVIKVGKSLFGTFSNPKKALIDLVDLIKNNLLNRLKSFGVILEAIINRDFTKLKDGFIQMGTGIENASAKLNNFNAGINKFTADAIAAAAAAEKLTIANQKIAGEERALNVERAKSLARIEALKKSSDDVTKSTGQRLKDAKEANSLETSLANKEVKLAQDKINSLLAEQKLKKNILSEDRDALAQLEIEKATKQQASLTLQTELQNKINSLNVEAAAKVQAAADKQKANNEKAAADKKALTEKILADEEAARNTSFDIQKKRLDAELKLTEKNSQEQLNIIKRQKALETAQTLQGLDDRYAKAGEAEKKQITLLKAEVTKEGQAVQKQLDDDFLQEQLILVAKAEKLKSETRILTLKEGTAEYVAALLDIQQKAEALALLELKREKGTEEEKSKLLAEGVKTRADINDKAAADLKAKTKSFNIGTSILTKVFGVSPEEVDKFKENLNNAFNTGLEASLSILASLADARKKALDAQFLENENFLNAAKDASDELKSELDESQSRIDELEGALKGTRGIERQAILEHLAEERKRAAAIAADKKKEDERIKQAEKQKLELEKKRTAEAEKQAKVQQSLNALQAVSVAIGATQAGIEAAITIAKTGAKGKVGFDNIALIIAATVAMGAAFVAVKSAAKGFAKGGYTGAGEHPADESGHRVAGVVHAGEWVAPKWLVESPRFSSTIQELEQARATGQGYAAGGFAQIPVPASQAGVDTSMITNMYAELISLRKDTNSALQKPSQFVVTQYNNHVDKTAQIQNYFNK